MGVEIMDIFDPTPEAYYAHKSIRTRRGEQVCTTLCGRTPDKGLYACKNCYYEYEMSKKREGEYGDYDEWMIRRRLRNAGQWTVWPSWV